MFDFIRNNTKRQRLYLVYGFLYCFTVSKGARKLQYLSQPAAIILLLVFDGQYHDQDPK